MRHLSSRILLAASALMTLVHGAPAKDFFVYFGTYTGPLSKGIYVSKLDATTGNLSAPELAAETPSPGFLDVSPDGKFLYAANNNIPVNGENVGAVTAFAIDKNSGHLTLLNEKPTGGSGNCHVSVDSSANVLFAANYSDGSVKSFRLQPDGEIGADGSFIKHHGSSVNTNRQTSAHAHFIHSDPTHRFALACDLGMDKVVVYKINPADGTLAENSSAAVPPGAGSRHLAFSPDGRFAHVVNEMGCSITTFAWDSDAGKLTSVETVSALPPGMTAKPSFTAAEILAPDDFVYVTLRGHDSVSVFTANPETGRLKFVQNVPSGGRVPRGLGIDPTCRWLFTGNQNSDNVVEYAIDPHVGTISATGRQLKIGSPIDVKFVEAP
jgi:6-phosphogluconolactonase